MFEGFPNLHALVVHFPVVLLLAAAALQAVLVFKDWQQVRWIALVAMAGGFAGGIAASTTFHAMPWGLPPKAAAIFAIHEQYAGYTLWLAGITLLLAGVGEYFQIRRRAYAVLVLLPALAAAGAVSWTGHHGAQLVYVEGVGPKGNMVMSEEQEAQAEKAGMGSMGDMNMGNPAGNAKAGENSNAPATDSAAGRKPPPGMNDRKGMEGMERSGNAAPQPAEGQSDNPMSGMGSMDMSGKPGPGNKMPAQGQKSTPDMSGMKTKKQTPKGLDMKGMRMEGRDMKATPSQRAERNMPAMPGMNMSKGMGKQPAGARRQPPMNGTPGMNDAGKGQQPASPETDAMKGMPGMEKNQAMPTMGPMPGLAMPNPLDKFHFEDNNPNRSKPTKNK